MRSGVPEPTTPTFGRVSASTKARPPTHTPILRDAINSKAPYCPLTIEPPDCLLRVEMILLSFPNVDHQQAWTGKHQFAAASMTWAHLSIVMVSMHDSGWTQTPSSYHIKRSQSEWNAISPSLPGFRAIVTVISQPCSPETEQGRKSIIL